MRKILCSLAVLAVCVGVAVAEELNGTITKVDGNKITFQQTKINKEEKKFENVGEAKTLTAKDGVKVVKGVFNKETFKIDAGDEIPDGLKTLAKIGEKGVRATIVTDADGKTITEIRLMPQFKKKNQ